MVAKESGIYYLSPRHLEIALLLAKGLSNEGIAGRLRITKRTVANCLSMVYDNLGPAPQGCHPRVWLALIVLRLVQENRLRSVDRRVYNGQQAVTINQG